MRGHDVLNWGWLAVYNRPSLGVGLGVHFCHAHKGGYAVLIRDSSWKTVNGILLNTPRGAVWLMFRRWRTKAWRRPVA